MVAVDLASICGPDLVTWIWFLFLCVVPHGHCGSSKQLWTQSDCPVHHCSVHHCCLEGPLGSYFPPCWFYRYLSHLAEVTTLPRPWYSACMVRKICSLGSCYSLVILLLAGRDIPRWPAIAVVGLEPFKVNGLQVMGSCTPPYKWSETVASDTFSIRFDNGFKTECWSRNMGT
jgi:hypothetical protein